MLNTLRRGPTLLSRSLLLPSSLSTTHSINQFPLGRLLPVYSANTSPTRLLHSTSQWRRYAAAVAKEEDMEEYELGAEKLSRPHHPISHSGKALSSDLITKFQELADRGMVSPTVVNTLTQEMKLETMTQVQSMTINETLKGIDVLAQARTGTGKTLAFLIPVLQNIISNDPSLERPGRNRPTAIDIRAIIISPTRELAEQIAVEAQKVVKNTGVVVQTAVGGTLKTLGLRKIKTHGCHILVGTPGRLNDILSDQYSGVRAPKLSALVLDEADRLLDQGFAPEIEAIQGLLPDRRDVDRQTLLFSATVPEEVMNIVNRTMKPDYKFVRTVQPGEQQTHDRVPQKLVQVAGLENLMPALVELFQREMNRANAKMPFKAIVYFNATAEARLAMAILENLRPPGADRFGRHPFFPTSLIEMHGKLTQQARTRNADAFRRAESAIMLSSDVTARGMDFPNVTHVIQILLPTSRDTYIHRLGRTARGDKTGEGWLFIIPLELREAENRLRKLPLQLDESLQTASVNMTEDAQLPATVAQTLTQVIDAARSVNIMDKSAAYLATLGCFNWYHQKQQVLDAMNSRSKYGWGLDIPPKISPQLVTRLNLHRVTGINIGTREHSLDKDRYSSDRGGFSRGGSSGGMRDRSSSGFGRSSSSSLLAHERDSSSSYGSRDRGSSSSYGSRDRGSSSGYGRERSGYSDGRSGSSFGKDGGRSQDMGGFGARRLGTEGNREQR